MSTKLWIASLLLAPAVLRAQGSSYSDFDDGAAAARPVRSPAAGLPHCGPWVREGFVSVQVNVDKRGCNIVGDAANEPSMVVDPTNPRRMAIGWRQFDTTPSEFRQPGWAYSHDAGRTWQFPGSIDPGVVGSDPVLAPGPDGEFYYLTINLDESRLFRSVDGGLTWSVRSQIAPRLLDKPWITVDLTDGIGRGNIYIVGPRIFRSTDGGLSFHGTDSSAFPAHVTTDSTGIVYVVETVVSAGFAKSTNALDPHQDPVFDAFEVIPLGGTFLFGGEPNPGGLMGQGWVAVDQSGGELHGNVYVLGSVSTGDVHFIRSEDGGKTWSPYVQVNDDPPVTSIWQWFGMMSVAPNGRIDAAWNDTRNSPDNPRLSELFYAFSTDGGRTWSKNIPVSPQFNSWVGFPQGNKIGDYYHMTSDNLGANIAYAATFNNEQDIYFLRIGPHDCNGNEVPDEADIEASTSLDCNGNGVPDECEYRADFDGDGLTTPFDHRRFVRCQRRAQRFPRLRCCALFDIEPDGDIDLADYAFLQRAFAP